MSTRTLAVSQIAGLRYSRSLCRRSPVVCVLGFRVEGLEFRIWGLDSSASRYRCRRSPGFS